MLSWVIVRKQETDVQPTWSIIIAGGRDQQISKEINTAFLNLGAKPLLAYSLDAVEKASSVDAVAITAPREYLAEIKLMVNLFGYGKVRKIVSTRPHRLSAVGTALQNIEDDVGIVLVHDVNRPCVTPGLIDECFKAAKRYGAAAAAQEIHETVKVSSSAKAKSSLDERRKYWIIQTPQAYKYDVLKKMLEYAAKKKTKTGDLFKLAEATHNDPKLVSSDVWNIKVGTPSDLKIAAAILGV